MATTVTASAGDTLCGIAIGNGFLDCRSLRADPANALFLSRPLRAGDVVTIPQLHKNVLQKAAEKLHVFKRKAVPAPSIRFVHGSSDKPYRDDAELNAGNHFKVSRFVSNKGGVDGSGNFPSGFGFDALGDSDPASFKIEVVDTNAGADLLVELEALKPIYTNGIVSGHESFSDPQASLRKVKVTCKKIQSPTYKGYRSRYLRLVTDEEDLKILSGDPVKTDGSAQGLYTSDMADGNDGDPDKVEILDQLVQATYVVKGCQATDPNKCKVQTRLTVGPNRTWIKVAVHVMRKIPGNDISAVVTKEQATRRIRKWFRRVYAQNDMAPKLVTTTRLVDPMENLIAISDNNGSDAAGGGANGIKFKIHVKKNGADDREITIGPHTPLAGDSTKTTADALAGLINGGVNTIVVARTVQNPPTLEGTITKGSADIIITDPGGGRVSIAELTFDDPAQTVTVGRVTATGLVGWAAGSPAPLNWVAGSIQQRTMLQNFDTGSDRIDIVVVDTFSSGDRGQAMMPGTIYANGKQAIDQVTMSAFVAAEGMDGTDNNPFSCPHEAGHVLLDAIHSTDTTQLMKGPTSDANIVSGTKRFASSAITFDSPSTPAIVQEDRIRAMAGGVLQPF